MKVWTTAAAMLLALAGLSVPARSQTPAAQGNRVDYSADQVERVTSQCLITLSGAAEVVQGQSRLRAHTIAIKSHTKPGAATGAPASGGAPDAGGQDNCGATDRMTADGEVYYVTPTQTARGDHAVYSADDGKIVMTGNVVAVQGKDVLTGESLTIDVNTRNARINGAGGKRVRGVIYTNQTGGIAAPGAPAAAASPAAAPPVAGN